MRTTRYNRVSYGEPVYWTLENLHDVLFKALANGTPRNSLILLPGCDYCTNSDEGGIEVKGGWSPFDGPPEKTVHVKRYAGFEDKKQKEE